MKKTFVLLLMIVLLTAFGFSQTQSSRFSLKLSGGMGYFSVGELNSVMKGESDYNYAWASNVSGRFENMHLGLNFSLEVVYGITERVGIGLGGGFFQVSKKDMMHYEHYNNIVRNDHTYTRTISCVPLTLNIHYTYPVGSKLTLSLSGGVGYYLASFEFKGERTEVVSTFTNNQIDTYDFETKGTVGLQASLGLDMALTKNMGVFIGARAWYATISGFLGEWKQENFEYNEFETYNESGVRFWVCDREFGGVKYAVYDIDTHALSPGGDFSNIRELKIDLSGFSLGAGIRFNF